MEFQTSDVSICDGNKKYLIESSIFHTEFCVQTLYVSIAVANSISSKYYLYFLSNNSNHKLAKFEQNRMIRTTQNFDLFDKNKKTKPHMSLLRYP